MAVRGQPWLSVQPPHRALLAPCSARCASPCRQKAKPLDSKSGVCVFDSHHGYVTVEDEVVEIDTEPVTHSVLCRPERSPAERAAQKERRALGFDNAKRLLAAAEEKALVGEVGVAEALTKIAQMWDTVSY